MLSFIDRLLNEHKGIRRFLVLWSAGIITYVTYKIFSGDFSKISGSVVAAYTSVCALLTTTIGFYHWQRGRENERTNGPNK